MTNSPYSSTKFPLVCATTRFRTVESKMHRAVLIA